MDNVTIRISDKFGWDTNERSKSYAIDKLSHDGEDGKCIPHSAKTHAELRTRVHGERGMMAALPYSREGWTREILFG